MSHLGAPTIDRLPTELRETRLRTLIDELRWERDALRRENKRYRDRIERQETKIKLLRRERSSLDARIELLLREMARGGRA